MAEEDKAPGRIESLIQVSPEFAEMLTTAIRSRHARPQDPDVEGHAMSVEEFSTAPGAPTVCGLYYSSLD
jgi:hypothetical protein